MGQLGEEGNTVEGSVVGNEQTTADIGELGEGHVLEGSIANERDITLLGVGEVGGAEGLEEVGVEAGRTVDDLKRRDRKLGHVGDGHIGSPDKVGELDIETDTNAVGLDDESVADAAELGRVLLQAAVVVDVEDVDRGELNAVEGLEHRVANGDRLGAREGAESNGAQEAERLPLKRVDGGEAAEIDGIDLGDVPDREGATNALEGAAGNRLKLAVVLDPEIARDLLGARDIDRGTGLTAENDRAPQGLAASKLRGLGRAGDRGGATGDSASGLGWEVGSGSRRSSGGISHGHSPAAEPIAARAGRRCLTSILSKSLLRKLSE